MIFQSRLQTALLMALIAVLVADLSSEDVKPGLSFRFGNRHRIDFQRSQFTKPTPFLEQDLRIPGAYLLNGNGGSRQGFLVQYSSNAGPKVLAGSSISVSLVDMPDFNQESAPEDARFDTLAMATQINESYVLLPEYRRGCIRVFDRDQNVVRPFIGQCSSSPLFALPTASYSPDFSNYTIRKPFSITWAPMTKKLYIIDYSFGSNLHQVDLVSRTARNLGKFPDSTYSVVLDSTESIGYCRTANAIVKINLPETLQDATSEEPGTLDVELVAGQMEQSGAEPRFGGGEFAQPLFSTINDLRWLKKDQVLIASDLKSLKIVDLRQETVASICPSAVDSKVWIQNGDNMSVCAEFNPDLLVIEDGGQIVLTNLYRLELRPNIYRQTNEFYRFTYNELFCDNSYLKHLKDTTILNTPQGDNQQVSTTHTYSCINGYSAPYSLITCVAEEQQLMWKPAPPTCTVNPEKKPIAA